MKVLHCLFLALTSLAAASMSCSTDVDCNLAGQCVSGACVCDVPWTGGQCTHLDFQQGPKACGLQDASRKETWGASIIQENASSFHSFTSYFKDGSLSSWMTNSVVAHAWAPNVTGPYVMDDDVLVGPSGAKGQWDASNCHNPTIHRIGSDYVLFYIGMDYTSENKDARQTIGAASSASLSGPWQRMEKPLLKPVLSWEQGGVSNPAILVNENGSIVMFYRGNQDRGMGVASAPHWRGPYTRRNNNESIIPAPDSTGLEDMYVLRNKRGGCHMVLHQEKQGNKVGGHIFTADAECVTGWRLAQPAPYDAYDLAVKWQDASTTSFKRRERPQFIFTDGSATPTYLSNAVEGSCAHGQRSCSIVVPLGVGHANTIV